MSKHEDHPFVKTLRDAHDIPADADFVAAAIPKFICANPAERKRDLMGLDAALKDEPAGLRQQTQLAATTRRLKDVDARLRRAGR